MSALLVDLGNSRWKIAIAAGGRLTDVNVGEYQETDRLRRLLEAARPHVGEVWVASVADGSRTRSWLDVLRGSLQLPHHLVSATDPMPNVRSGYIVPGQLGVDRLLAMVAARARSSRALCVVDAGTAITVDFVDADGGHLGGFILPGLQLFRDSLLARTSIPRHDDIRPKDVFGRDTATAVALGARHAVAGLVERFVSGSRAAFPGQPVDLIVGGGDAALLRDVLPSPCITLHHLVLHGLAVLAADGEAECAGS